MQGKNILLVSFDDAVAPWAYKSVFDEPLQTPNLDRLCEVSTAFHAAFSQVPICGPSRASMVTGTYPHETDIFHNRKFIFNEHSPTLSWIHSLKSSGYYCSSGGKIHHKVALGPNPHRKLYSDERKEWDPETTLPRHLRKTALTFGGHRRGRATRDPKDDDIFFDHKVATSAIDFLESYDGETPFYREVGFFSPHGPHLTPGRFKEAYNAKNLKRPPEWGEYQAETDYLAARYPGYADFADEDFWQKSIRNYFGAYSHGDYHLGRVLDALKASRHAENTVVIVVADHGFHLGNRNLFQKTTLWEQSLNVPFVIYDPQNPVKREITEPVAMINLGATILDYAGVTDRPTTMHGQSLRPVVESGDFAGETVASFYRGDISIRKGPYRLIRFGNGDFQLFNSVEDPWNLKDLGSGHPAFAGMKEDLAEWMSDHGYQLRGDGYDLEPDEEIEL